MNYRKLSTRTKTSAIEVSELCFGTMRYADKSGKADERSAAGTRALETAIEQGVNFIHSSYEYKTRWLTGAVLKTHPGRHGLHHIIKVNVPDWEEPRFSADSFRRQVEEALRDLGTERIAVVQHLQRGVARPDILTPAADEYRLARFDEVSSELAEISTKLQSEGKIHTVVSYPYTTAYARRAVEAEVFSGLAAYFNPLETEMVEFFDRLQELNKDFISIRPLCGGILTNRRVERDSLPAGDRMRNPSADEWYRRLAAVRPAIGNPTMSWEQFAFRFSLAHPVIKSSVLGINSVAHLETAAGSDTVDIELVMKAAEANQVT